MKIFPAITTISPNWRDKLSETKELKLEEISIFPTCLNLAERKELYELLKETKIKRIPFVHLRSDMDLWELDYLIKNYGTRVFNTHTAREYPLNAGWTKHKDIIHIENTYEPLDEQEIKRFAGICLDFSHLENNKNFRPEIYQHNIKMIEKYGCYCNHIGPAKSFPFLNKKANREETKHPHLLDDLSELDYLRKYTKYFSPFMALEMENSIKEQLKAREYLQSF